MDSRIPSLFALQLLAGCSAWTHAPPEDAAAGTAAAHESDDGTRLILLKRTPVLVVPGGGQVGSLPAGLELPTAVVERDGWIELPAEFVQSWVFNRGRSYISARDTVIVRSNLGVSCGDISPKDFDGLRLDVTRQSLENVCKRFGRLPVSRVEWPEASVRPSSVEVVVAGWSRTATRAMVEAREIPLGNRSLDVVVVVDLGSKNRHEQLRRVASSACRKATGTSDANCNLLFSELVMTKSGVRAGLRDRGGERDSVEEVLAPRPAKGARVVPLQKMLTMIEDNVVSGPRPPLVVFALDQPPWFARSSEQKVVSEKAGRLDFLFFAAQQQRGMVPPGLVRLSDLSRTDPTTLEATPLDEAGLSQNITGAVQRIRNALAALSGQTVNTATISLTRATLKLTERSEVGLLARVPSEAQVVLNRTTQALSTTVSDESTSTRLPGSPGCRTWLDCMKLPPQVAERIVSPFSILRRNLATVGPYEWREDVVLRQSVRELVVNASHCFDEPEWINLTKCRL